jgi:cytochrome c peroxidase
MRYSVLAIVSIVVLASVTSATHAGQELMERAQTVFKPIPASPPALEGNPLTPGKTELGKMLFFDPRLSASALISCNTCHNIGMGGDDYQETSVGHGWQKGPRNAPTVLNSVFNIAQFWDGRAPNLKEQAKGPVQAGVEMNNTPEATLKTLASMPEYVARFKKVFPGDEDPMTFDNMAKAIEAFEATLLTPDSPFDKYLKGDAKALTQIETEGLKLFMAKGCSGCHGGINMGGAGYFPFGVVERPDEKVLAGDVGRYKVTGTKTDEYVFKSPSLRNIVLTPPYFHSGKVWDLKEALAIMGAAQLGIVLSEEEIDNVEAFLKSLTGVQPQVTYPVLPASTRDTPKPKLN